MESQGLADEVQVSDSTFRHLHGKFELEERGTIDVNGIGPMRTWLVRRAR